MTPQTDPPSGNAPTPKLPSVEELEATLADTRSAMTSTVDELVTRLHPATVAKDLKEDAFKRSQEAMNSVKDAVLGASETIVTTLDRASLGDERSKKIVYGVLAGAGVALALVVIKLIRR
ncbi:MAG: DUF3618 domain-containing protein [Actinomycetaceae bacterium]|nr:DUF3618 domain-containing protein [Actinomycetaceae bacterium]